MVAVGAIPPRPIRRLFHPAPARSADDDLGRGGGHCHNRLTALLFARGRAHDINVRGAFQHMAADAAVSAAVVFAGVVILWTGQQWVDPVMSLAVARRDPVGQLRAAQESVGMSLMGVPSGIDVDKVEDELASLDGVDAVHDLHVWPLSTTETALTAHLVAPDVGVD